MKKLMITTMVLLVLSTMLFGEFKIGYINSNEIFLSSSKVQSAQQEYQSQIAGWQEQITKIQEDIKQLEQEYQTKKAMLSDSGLQEAESKIQRKYINAEETYQNIFGENGLAKQKENELLGPITEEINQIVEQVAIDNNYDYVLDVSMGVVQYAKEVYDITDEVIEKLEESTGSTDNK
ncbi:MAG: OmpH family outer membrane protein [Candidatus Cloacimonadota bacterium]|nr:OmpH family outer membrane protein [Candidatus Cloacimonadota bacterium]